MANKRYPKPRKWCPKNVHKYIGDINCIIARSSWEIKFLNWCDSNTSVISYNSEGLKINYVSPLDNKVHKYHVDFLAKMKLKDGTEKMYAIEVKPRVQCLPPSNRIKNKQRLITETATYVVNQAKWAAAKEFCSKRNIEFIVINEKDLCI